MKNSAPSQKGGLRGHYVLFAFILALAAFFALPGFAQTCDPPPSGLVSWWPAEGNATDIVDGLNGTLTGGANFAAGKVGQAFNISATDGSGVSLGNPAALQLQNFTIEAWVQLASATATGDRVVLGYGSGGYIFGIRNTGALFLSRVGTDIILSSFTVTDTSFHHVAVTKAGSTAVFYLDGVATAAISYSTTYTFTTPLVIGARGDNLTTTFAGKIDELSIYNRALAASEVQAIFNAGSAGKCVSAPPMITTQPVGETVTAGNNTGFTVTATGTPPLFYQWKLNNSIISGATGTALNLPDVQTSSAGNYLVVVSNNLHSVTSSVVALTVNPATCIAAPAGLISWWPAEGNTFDIVGGNAGTVAGTVTYAPGQVGQAFNFNGSGGSGLTLGNPAALQLQNFTIEAWVQLANLNASGDQVILGYGDSGYIFGIRSTGNLFLSKAGNDLLTSTYALGDTAFHHLAMTKTGTTVVFYVDGTAYPAAAYTSTFSFGTTAAIGARGDDLTGNFNGNIDELSFYGRALAGTEIQAIYSASTGGKCVTVPPLIVTQPISETVVVGNSTSFSVSATGATPLSYQWKFNNASLSGATASTLNLVNLQLTNAGNYSVTVSNPDGSTNSASAVLIVDVPGCIAAPAGLISWWQAEGNPTDIAGGNNGTIAGTVAYAVGEVGQAFSFTGATGNAVNLGNPTALQLQNFTIEGWVQLTSPTSTSDRVILGYGSGGYVFGVRSTGMLFLSKADADLITSTYTFSDTALHHVAITKNGTTAIFYVDGVAYPAPSYSTSYSFGTPAAIGARGDNLTSGFAGKIDELSFYGRALANTEIQAIYGAAAFGKCNAFSPVIGTPPVGETVLAGSAASFSVTASGSTPLSYQWKFNSGSISGATGSVFNLANAQAANAGNYSVTVSNPEGSTNSTSAVLTVDPAGCTAAPTGLISLWEAEGNSGDVVGDNNGTVVGTVNYAAGEVGEAFSFGGGTGSAVNLGNPATMQLQNFTIEAWVQLTSPTSTGDRVILGYGSGGYIFGVRSTGVLFLSKAEADLITSTYTFSDTAFHHVAITKNGTTAIFYVDGVAYPAPSYSTSYTFGTPVAIGARGDNLTSVFTGKIDELSFYGRALAATEIEAIYAAGTAGKCVVVPPSIVTSPVSEVVNPGGTAGFSVVAVGPAPLSYQWKFNNSAINGATASTFSLANVQAANAGNYLVTVTNAYGAVTSSVAVLSVSSGTCVPPPAGLVSWWPAEGNASDIAAGDNGLLTGSVTFASGEVGQAFNFTGSAGTGVTVGNPAALQLQNFTIEAWVQLASLSATSDRNIFAYGDKGYIFGIRPTGTPFLSKAGNDLLTSTYVFADTAFHHVAVTKNGTVVVFYVDGVAYPAPSYSTSYSFGTTAAIGARGDDLSGDFNGKIDEVSVYNRALAASEIQGIYGAGSVGKCSVSAPVITGQPTNQSVVAGQTAAFSVLAAGLGPLTYQWKLGSTAVSGATSSALVLNDAQSANAGNYTVVVGNASGSVTSSIASLTVTTPTCVSAPGGLVSWWSAEGNAFDVIGGNNGTIVGNVTYAAGEVGQAFNFNGANGAGVTLPNPAALQLQNFTIEAWIQLSTTTLPGDQNIFGYGDSGYLFGIRNTGAPFLSRVNSDVVLAGTAVTDTAFHHVAVTKNGTSVTFYVDGVAYPVPAYGNTFGFGTTPAIGARGDNLSGNFTGKIDEVSVYNRALAAAEVLEIYNASQAGKCSPPPTIVTQPANQTVIVGATATFSVTAAGAPPLSYQWEFGSSPINGATNSSLTLNNVQFTEAGSFKVVVSNGGGSVTSTPATLSVTPPPSAIQVVSVTATSALITVPIDLVAQGSENALGFSVNFDPTLLTFNGVALGSGASGASFIANTNLAGSGKLGLIFAQPAGSTFVSGTNELADITFVAVANTNSNVAAITFGDQPTLRQVSDAQANILMATYTAGTVTIPFLGFEGDVSPLPNGDNNVSIIDWVQEGRFVAGLDAITNAGEFQRADCAPRATLGDGALTVADWVQVGRYAVGLDPLTPGGGPTSPISQSKLSISPAGLSPRTITLVNTNGTRGQSCQVSIQLNAQGNENALGYSVNFDPAVLTFTGASLGGGATGATLNVNTNQSAAGTVGLALALPIGSTFSAATHEVVRLKFAIASSAKGSTAITFSSGPVVQAVADSTANTLSATFVPGTLAVTLPTTPNLTITPAHGGVVLSWPASATGFNLESNPGLGLSNWTSVATAPVTNSATSNITVTLPSSGTQQYYRLHHP